MSAARTAQRIVGSCVLVVSAAVGVACSTDDVDTGRAGPAALRSDGAQAVTSGRAARNAAVDFLDDYVTREGRVVRRDEGGDTVSEGQAYGMLLAVAADDEGRFGRIWAWTQQHLQRDDGLLSWRWADGAVTDPMPATDADLDAAHALVLASEAFGEPGYRWEAARIGAGILEAAVTEGAQGPVAVAGPWAVEDRWVNPSYGAPVAYAALSEVTGNAAWDRLDDAARRVATLSAVASDLPPDWAVLTASAVEPRGAPTGGDPVHGWEAGRVAIRFASDCHPDGPAIAAGMAEEYEAAADDHGRPPAVLDLAGEPLAEHGSPLMTVARAAAELADGERATAARLLDSARVQAMEAPSYYGDAWVALGLNWLTTDRLGGCAA